MHPAGALQNKMNIPLHSFVLLAVLTFSGCEVESSKHGMTTRLETWDELEKNQIENRKIEAMVPEDPMDDRTSHKTR